MCKYCERKDEFEPYVKVRKETLPFGARAHVTNEVFLYLRDDSAFLNFECGIEDEIENMIADVYVPIRYCPFCGDELFEVKTEAENKIGKWSYNKDYDANECSHCGQMAPYKTPFCPNCGNPMEVEE